MDPVTAKEVVWFEHANDLTEKFFLWVKKNTDFDVQMDYTISYFQYLRYSKQSNAAFRLKKSRFENTSINFSSMLYETETPYRLHLWFYDLGEHHFHYTDLVSDFTEKDFPDLWKIVVKFFGLSFVQHDRYEQLTLF